MTLSHSGRSSLSLNTLLENNATLQSWVEASLLLSTTPRQWNDKRKHGKTTLDKYSSFCSIRTKKNRQLRLFHSLDHVWKDLNWLLELLFWSFYEVLCYFDLVTNLRPNIITIKDAMMVEIIWLEVKLSFLTESCCTYVPSSLEF